MYLTVYYLKLREVDFLFFYFKECIAEFQATGI